MTKLAKAQDAPSFNLCVHSHETCTYTPPSASSARERLRLKVMSTQACTPWEEPKVEHSRMVILDTFLTSPRDEEREKRGLRKPGVNLSGEAT